MYSSTSARSAVISIRLAPSRTMASRSKLRSDRSSSPTTMLNMGVPSMDGLSAALGLQQTGGYATLLSPNSFHHFALYPLHPHSVDSDAQKPFTDFSPQHPIGPTTMMPTCWLRSTLLGCGGPMG